MRFKDKIINCVKRPAPEQWLLLLILAVAFFNRLMCIGYSHFDEKLFFDLSYRVFSTGDLNPHWFGHPGSFNIYLLAIVLFIVLRGSYFFGTLFGGFSGYEDFTAYMQDNYFALREAGYIAGRFMMLTMAVITVYLVYLVVKRLTNKKAALLSALCLALAPLHINYSCYLRTDSSMTMLLMASTYFLLRHVDSKERCRFIILAAFFAGLAISSKYTAGVVVLPVIIHALITDIKNLRSPRQSQCQAQSPGPSGSSRARRTHPKQEVKQPPWIVALFTKGITFRNNTSRAMVFIFLGFFTFAPFVLIDHKASIKAMKFEARSSHGSNTSKGISDNIKNYLSGPLNKGLGGMFFEIIAGVGLLSSAVNNRYRKLLTAFFPVVYLAAMSMANLYWERWMVPVMPYMAVFYGVGAYFIYDKLVKVDLKMFSRKIVSAAALLVVFVFTIPAVKANYEIYEKKYLTDTLTLAQKWAQQHVPVRTLLVYEKPIELRLSKAIAAAGIEGGVLSVPVEQLKKQRVSFAFLTSQSLEKYRRQPESFSRQLENYKRLQQTAKLIKTIEPRRDGPIVEIFQIMY